MSLESIALRHAERELGVLRERLQRAETALGDDASGRPFAELLYDAAALLSANGGGPIADCLALKAADVGAALVPEEAATTVPQEISEKSRIFSAVEQEREGPA